MRQQIHHCLGLLCLALLTLAGCAAQTTVDNSSGRATTYVDAQSPGPIQGVGIESQDISSMCDKMMRDILNSAQIAGRQPAPIIILDDAHFKNESTSRINRKIITDQLRVELNRAAQGRMYFASRENIEMVEKERLLKREGVVTSGTLQQSQATAGADFRLTGRIASLDVVAQSGFQSRYHQIVFELVNLENGIIMWSNRYDFKKTAQDDIVYR
jgi:PBP1b-binding outer membrane lipoprotein LpoB